MQGPSQAGGTLVVHRNQLRQPLDESLPGTGGIAAYSIVNDSLRRSDLAPRDWTKWSESLDCSVKAAGGAQRGPEPEPLCGR